jgi:hypothetical protein
LNVIVWICHLVSRRSIPHLEVKDVLHRLILQVVSVSRTCGITNAHAWGQLEAALAGAQRRISLHDVDELRGGLGFSDTGLSG